MARLLFEEKWENSRGEIDGWSFTLDGDIVRWEYRALFDRETDETSSGSAIFDLASFKKFLADFQRNGKAELIGRDAGSIQMKRTAQGNTYISVGAARGVGITRILPASELDALAQLVTDPSLSARSLE